MFVSHLLFKGDLHESEAYCIFNCFLLSCFCPNCILGGEILRNFERHSLPLLIADNGLAVIIVIIIIIYYPLYYYDCYCYYCLISYRCYCLF